MSKLALNKIALDGFDDLFDGKVSLESKTPVDLDLIDSFFEKCLIDDPTRCIDGRSGNEGLGAQVIGGTAGLALSVALTSGQSKLSFKRQTEVVASKLKEAGFAIGGHEDEGNNSIRDSNSPTGCGAIDKAPDTIKRIVSNQESINALLSSLLGSDFDEATSKTILSGATALDEDDHFFDDTFRMDVINAINSSVDYDNVEVLRGGHQEGAIILNHIPFTTLNRNKYDASDHDENQLFNYDVWYVEDVAELLFDTKEDRRVFLAAHVMLSLGTAMVLTDGSLDVIIRQLRD